MTLPVNNDLRTLFLSAIPLMDVRAPVEFEAGAFPGAWNLPLLDDDERARVGTTYKNEGQDAAVELGSSLVSGDLKDARVQAWVEFARQNPDGCLYCFRGGMRSQIVQQWLKDEGITYPRVDGGYKRMRRFLLEQLDRVGAELDVIVLGGRTGVGKTTVLGNFDSTVDLEGLANHRGSSFGRWLSPQPTQINFDNRLAIELMGVVEQGHDHVVLEDEGTHIGHVSIPKALVKVTAAAPLVVLEADIESRVDETVNGYITDNLAANRAGYDEERAFENFGADLVASLGRIRKRLGGERHTKLEKQLRDALAQQLAGAPLDVHRDWIRTLLTEYYDPMYDYQLERKRDRVVFQGDLDAVLQWYRSSRKQIAG